MSIYDYKFKTIEGKEASLSDYKGKVLLIVNTASECGFTPQYEGLEKLNKAYSEKGLVVIGFPCNQFRGQEPGSNTDIDSFCKIRYGVTFPLSEKIHVREESADPLFKYLTSNTSFEGIEDTDGNKKFDNMLKDIYGDNYPDSSIKWNFTKFLIDREGNIAGRFESPITPDNIIPSIEKYL